MAGSSSPDISIILPVYNSGKYLEESIESILNQTFDNFELIIVYDKSNDNSKEIIEKYMKIDKRIIFIENETKSGIVNALNKGLEIARGQYIARMDSDDISLSDRLETEYLFLENNKDYFLVGSNGIRIDQEGTYLEDIKLDKNPSDALINKRCPIIHSSIMFRNIGMRYEDNLSYAEDYDLYRRALEIGLKLRNIQEALVKYRMRPSSITMTKDLNKNPRDLFLKAMIGFSLKNGKIEEAKEYFKEYKDKIKFIDRIKYRIVLTFPIIYPIRFKIKLFLKDVFQK